ncbi:MAG: ubiquitin-conjugating enzyme E2 variant [Flavobacteriales bacterium]|jgi:hypothetical protein
MFPHQKRRILKEFQKNPQAKITKPLSNSVQFVMEDRSFNAELPCNYPFYPPKMKVNEKRISYAPYEFPQRLYNKYKKEQGCPCCTTMTCSGNWSPACGVIDIAKEYLSFINKLKTYQKIKMFEKSKFPDDMIKEIISYLQ